MSKSSDMEISLLNIDDPKGRDSSRAYQRARQQDFIPQQLKGDVLLVVTYLALESWRKKGNDELRGRWREEKRKRLSIIYRNLAASLCTAKG